MQAINSLLNPSQISLQDLQNGHHHHHHHHQHQQQQQHQHHPQIPNPSQIQLPNTHFDSSSHDDFLEQMLSTLPSWSDLPANPKSPWELNASNPISMPSNKSRDLSDDTTPSNPDNVQFAFDESAMLASKLRQHQISGNSSAAKSALMLQQQLLLSRGVAMGRSPSNGSGAGESGLLQLPLSLSNGDSCLVDRSQNDVVDGSSSFKSPNQVRSLRREESDGIHVIMVIYGFVFTGRRRFSSSSLQWLRRSSSRLRSSLQPSSEFPPSSGPFSYYK